MGVAAVYCDAVDDSATVGIEASYGKTLAGTVAVGTCAAGLNGLPQRQCQLNGAWDSTVLANPCSGTPPFVTVARAG
jgi:hypothetical protein